MHNPNCSNSSLFLSSYYNNISFNLSAFILALFTNDNLYNQVIKEFSIHILYSLGNPYLNPLSMIDFNITFSK